MRPKILQIMPAEGWRSVEVTNVSICGDTVSELPSRPHGLAATPLVGWALIESFDPDEEEWRREVVGLTTSERWVDPLHDSTLASVLHLGYLGPDEAFTPDEWEDAARDLIGRE